MSGSNDHIDENTRRYGNQPLSAAVASLHAGGLVVIPTETVYGLAADSTNSDAIADIYRTKSRPDFNPLIVHIAHLEMAEKLGQFNVLARRVAAAFWPGPLTIIVPRQQDCPVVPAVTAGLDTIALRCPAHPLMQELLTLSGLYLAAPSANKSGKISPTTPDHVRRSLGTAAPMILDGGPCESGIESTIVAVRGDDYDILREGPITAGDLQNQIGKPALVPDRKKIEAPGQLDSHYAPSKPLRLNAKSAENDEFYIGFGTYEGDMNLAPSGDLAQAAAGLFAALHQADASDHADIAVAPIPQHGIGAAINDRLRRAAH
ncbi:MAG: L-threonylcarbamoyladenylate synthase [Parasphingorhabdus sp.]|uniref:L-threonylcarbamoyladenylate synthase n=1 Tax=Parasphingorhabdus sp. TaxID=2709688 RepID=UPI0032984714